MNFLQNHVEALVFTSPAPLPVADIQACLDEMFGAQVPTVDIEIALAALTDRYGAESYSFQLIALAGGYQFLTKPAYQSSVGLLLKQQSKKRLSTSALETLAIIAYRQPVTRHDVEAIRGVNCDYAIQKLLDRTLIYIHGKAESVGRPLLYGTSPQFMEHLGLQSLRDLPQPKDLPTPDNEVGQPPEN